MQADGLAKRLEHAHAKTAVIGISGGLDSCLALLVAVRAMKQLGRPTSDVLAVTMPCFGTTKRTRSNAEILCDELAVSFTEIDIADTVHSHFQDIGQDESVLDVTYENAGPRAHAGADGPANRTGGLVVGTGDLSELALGWATYNGDHMSMYGVNAGVPKTLVRHLVQYEADIAARQLNVLVDILDTPVSPELLPAKETARSPRRPKSWLAPMNCTTSTFIMCSASALARRRFSGWPGAFAGRSRVPGQGAVQVAAQLLLAVLCPAVQAQLPARRPEDRQCDPLAARRLADAQRCLRRPVAGRAGTAVPPEG